MFEWIIVLYVFFVLLSAILNALKEAQKKRPITIPKAELPPNVEIERYSKKERIPKKNLEIVEPKTQIISYQKEEKEQEISKEKKIEKKTKENYIEKSLKNNLQEIIALIEIVGPPKAYQKWSLPYRKKD